MESQRSTSADTSAREEQRQAAVTQRVDETMASIPRQNLRTAYRLGLLAGGLTALWIVTSDLLLNLIVGDAPNWVGWSIVKGLAYSVVLGVVVASFANLWERRRIREAVRLTAESDLRARDLMEVVVNELTEGVLVLDEEGLVVLANPAAAAIVARSVDQLVGQHVTTSGVLLDQDGAPIAAEQLPSYRALRRGLRTTGLDAALQRHDGELRWLHIDGIPLHAPTPSLGASVMLILRDITELRAVRRAEQAAKAQFEAMITGTPDVFALIDVTGTVKYVSPAVEDVIGAPVAHVVGRKFPDFVHPEDLPRVEGMMARALADDLAPRPHEVRIQRSDGTVHHVEFTVANLREVPDVEAFGVVVRDITERHAIEQERRRHEQALQHINDDLQRAAAARDELIAVASHELRTPLTPIRGFAEILRHRASARLHDDELKMLDKIQANVDVMTQKVDQVLWSTGLRTGLTRVEPTTLPLRPAVEQAVRRAKLDDSSYVLDVDAAVTVHADPQHLDQMLHVLLSNATVYGEPPIEIRAWEESGTTTIRIADHGPGVPPEFQSRMWDRFTQSTTGDRRTAKGLGMGLYLARRLANLNAGAMTYENQAPHGAVFSLTLPATD